MTRGVVTVPLDTPVKEIVRILVDANISGIAVIAQDCKVGGVISEIDIIKSIDRDWNLLTAEDVMSSSVRTVDPEMSLTKAAHIMNELNIHRLLVLSLSPAYGFPVGILTASDILKAIARG